MFDTRNQDHQVAVGSKPGTVKPELPSFVRRCRYRNPRSTAHSEKLGHAITWTTAAQGDVASLLEITHTVVSYEAWPGSVTVRIGWGEPLEYWPAMGFVSSSGKRTFIDIVYAHEEIERRHTDFDSLLHSALASRDIGLILMPEASLRSDPKLRIARGISRYGGIGVDEGSVFALQQLLNVHGGRLALGELGRHGIDGAELVAKACILGMRRRLQLAVSCRGLDSSTVALITEAVAA